MAALQWLLFAPHAVDDRRRDRPRSPGSGATAGDFTMMSLFFRHKKHICVGTIYVSVRVVPVLVVST